MIGVSLDTLLDGKIVEQSSVEYKRGWDPDPIMRTICAFANDYNDLNGGFIVIGVDGEEGIPKLPPVGIPKEDLDRIQKEIYGYCNKIRPRYFPEIEVVNYKGTGVYLLYLRCTAGDDGPYQAPYSVTEGKKEGNKRGNNAEDNNRLCYWIRPASVTAFARNEEIAELYAKTSTVRFDDKINRRATISDIDERIVKRFLEASENSLAMDMATIGLEKTLLSLQVADETDRGLAIRNIGVLMFTEKPEMYIPEAKIELVRFRTSEEEGAYSVYEHTYNGPIWEQVNDIIGYIESTVIERKIVKTDGKIESDTYYNYPIKAIREIIVNAVFHKSYRQEDPVQVRIYEDHITVFNYPGLNKNIRLSDFVNGIAVPRQYQNRRIGELFKEIHFTEKQGSGIRKVLRELKNNGSPAPVFDMDESRSYLEATIYIRKGFYDDEHERKGDPNKVAGTEPGDTTNKDICFKDTMKQVLSYSDYRKLAPIIDRINENGEITPAEARKLCDKSASTIWRYMKLLLATKLVVEEGYTNNIVYRIA